MVRLPATETLPAGCLRVLAVLLDHQEGRRAIPQIVIATIPVSGRIPPTVQELANDLGVSLAVTHHHLARLRSHGLVMWQPYKSRTLRVTCTLTTLPEAYR